MIYEPQVTALYIERIAPYVYAVVCNDLLVDSPDYDVSLAIAMLAMDDEYGEVNQ